MYTVDARHPDIVGISAGAIVEPMHLVSTGHYFVDDKASWHEISDGLPQFGGRSGFESAGASSGGCSETMRSNSPSAIVQAQLDAYNAKDLEALLRTYAVDAEQFALNGERLARGHSELRTRFAVRLAEADIHARLLSRIVMGNVVTDHELVTRNFPEGRGSVEMLCIYEVLGGHIQKATFALGEKRLDADTRTKIQKGSA
ncbi:nuclear transport factor 2 family protein [Variovorax sp. J31P179]|uniref:nuclear transport factor 2 family protein n=1 Tax=Variovorax sp. J31P179 TaxID=3053508 RepID=UPI00257673AD|nr:nuclear transport factor 2 family protein [Variovorax sp. J31P179]MDM0081510.1 nuclear transport factor 2 family protein [Variovorax sp. J31P179]